MRTRLLLFVILMFVLGLGSAAYAQDPPPAEPPADVPTETTAEAPTDVPTEAPTDVPTEVPTDIPTEVPTEVPTEPIVEQTPEATTEPTLPPISIPPVASLTAGMAFDATAGIELTIPFSVSDDEGIVRVTVSALAGVVTVTASDPVEANAPFNTLVTVAYTAAADFVGADTLTITIIDATGNQVLLGLVVNVAAPQATLEPTPDPAGIPTKQLVINYNPAADEAAIQALLTSLGATEVQRIPQIGAMKVLVPDAISEATSAMGMVSGSAVAQAAGLVNIEELAEFTGFQDSTGDFIPNDALFTDAGMYGLKTGPGGTWTTVAWDHSPKRGLGVIVAVLDSGVDFTHPDLVGQAALGGWDFVNDDNNPADDYGHGTHVAGTIAAKTNNAIGVAGVAYNAKILSVKVLNNANSGNNFVISNGIVYAVDKGAKIINMSLGGTAFTTSMAAAVNYAITRGVIVIASAGNSGTNILNYPASYPGVISVAAHDSNATTASFSTFNNLVTISAPGVSILSTMLAAGPLSSPSRYGYLNGTSMAAPHVSGIAALLVSSGVATTPATVKEALICGARDENAGTPENLPGYDDFMGYGVVDADFAMKWLYNSPNCKVPQLNDNFESATNIATVPYSITQPFHSRSVTSQISDPVTCGESPGQTLWWKYKPTVSGHYQFNTHGSSFDTVLGVYLGNTPGALTQVACNDDSGIGATSLVGAQLTAGQTYYIVVDGFGSGWNDQVLALNVRSGIALLATDHQNNAPQISYTGTWATFALPSASGGNYAGTTDDSAVASFVFNGDAFELYRVIGPTQGDLEVYVDDVQIDFNSTIGGVQNLSNRAAITTGNRVQIVYAGYSGLHTVSLRRAAGGTSGGITLDRIRIYNSVVGNPVIGLTDDRDLTRIRYYNSGLAQEWFTATSPGSNANTVTYTTAGGAYVSFRARGSTITIYRTMAPSYGTANVFVDGVFYGVMSNNSTTGVKVPYIINNLSPSEHVIQITNQAGSTLEFDAVLPSVAAPIATKVDERAATIGYTGVWYNYALPGAYANGTRYTVDPTARVDFIFTGNALCIGYLAEFNGGTYNVLVDGLLIDTINADNPVNSLRTWCSHTSPTAVVGRQVFFTGIHRAEIVRTSAVTTYMELDFIQPLTYNLLTAARGQVQQTDPAITYAGIWGTATSATVGPTGAIASFIPTGAKSLGGYIPAGGSLRRSQQDGASASFFMNGTGFVIYTSVGPAQSCMEVFVDNTRYQFTLGPNIFDGIDLYVGSSASIGRYRPFAFSVNDLNPGMHKVQLFVDSNCSSLGYGLSPIFYVDIDAIRVFP